MSNNPFMDHSAPAHQRYPDISSPGPSYGGAPGWQQQQQQQPNMGGFAQQGYMQSPGGYGGGGGYQQQQQQMTGWGGNASYPGTTMSSGGFQPSSSFGQQMAAQLQSGYGAQPSYGGANAIGYQQQTGYGQAQQGGWGQQQSQQQLDWSAIAQFDPYSNLGSLEGQTGSGAGLFGGTQPASNPAAPNYGGYGQAGAGSGAPPGQLHPRDMIRHHKAALEAWDPYAWKQLTNSFDALKNAWEAREKEAEQRLRGLGNMPSYDYGAAQESQRLRGVGVS
jgi:hypothetical protein